MTINSVQKSRKSELFSGGKQMFEVGRWVRKYFENWAFGCENVFEIGRLMRKYFQNWAFGCENILRIGRLGANIL